MSRYVLQKKVKYDRESGTTTWKTVTSSPTLKSLIQVCPTGHRIYDTEERKVVYEP